MKTVLRCNFGDESIALIQWYLQNKPNDIQDCIVCYVDTGWSGASWPARVKQGSDFAKAHGFDYVSLTSEITFAAVVRERGSFPSPKFQWCAGFLKGVPFLQWLDTQDPRGVWDIVLPKRQALYRKPIPVNIEQCSYHGERRVLHPMHNITHQERDRLIRAAGFEPLYHRSLECDPCVNASIQEIAKLSDIDVIKTTTLEEQLNTCFFTQYNEPIVDMVKRLPAKVNATQPESNNHSMDYYSMGCGDPFGCGL